MTALNACNWRKADVSPGYSVSLTGECQLHGWLMLVFRTSLYAGIRHGFIAGVSHVSEKSLSPVDYVVTHRLSCGVGVPLAECGDDSQMSVRFPIFLPSSVVQMGKNRATANPQTFHQIVEHRQLTGTAKTQVEFRVQVDGFPILLELMAF